MRRSYPTPSTGAVGVRHQQHRGRPALLGGATRVGNFDERQWGISVSAVTGVLKPKATRPTCFTIRLRPSLRALDRPV